MGQTSTVINKSDDTVHIEEFISVADPLHHEPSKKSCLEPNSKIVLDGGVHIRFIYLDKHYVFRRMDGLKITILDDKLVTEGTANMEVFVHSDDPPSTEQRNTDTITAATATGAGIGATAVGAAAPVAAVAGVQAIGFGTGGIVAGSTAAGMMAAEGSVVAGGTVATLQSVGATGALAAAGTGAVVGVVVVGALVGAAVIGGAIYGGLKLHQHLKYKDNKCWDTCKRRNSNA